MREQARDPLAFARAKWQQVQRTNERYTWRIRAAEWESLLRGFARGQSPVPQNMIGPPYMPPNPGTQALKARYKDAKPAELEARTDLTAPFVAAIVRQGLNSMPFFRPTELSDDDLAAVGAYLSRKR